MKPGEVNDIGFGTCPKCKNFKQLAHLYWLDVKLPRKARRKCCGACNAVYKRESDPFFFVSKAIAAHKTVMKESDYSLRDLKELHRWQSFYCPYCDKPIHYSFTLDHVIPQKFGGKNKLANILLVCSTCNSSKQDFELVFWLNKKGFTVKPKILDRIRSAYHDHNYDFEAGCNCCTGSKNNNLCVKHPTNKNTYCISSASI